MIWGLEFSKSAPISFGPGVLGGLDNIGWGRLERAVFIHVAMRRHHLYWAKTFQCSCFRSTHGLLKLIRFSG